MWFTHAHIHLYLNTHGRIERNKRKSIECESKKQLYWTVRPPRLLYIKHDFFFFAPTKGNKLNVTTNLLNSTNRLPSRFHNVLALPLKSYSERTSTLITAITGRATVMLNAWNRWIDWEKIKCGLSVAQQRNYDNTIKFRTAINGMEIARNQSQNKLLLMDYNPNDFNELWRIPRKICLFCAKVSEFR